MEGGRGKEQRERGARGARGALGRFGGGTEGGARSAWRSACPPARARRGTARGRQGLWRGAVQVLLLPLGTTTARPVPCCAHQATKHHQPLDTTIYLPTQPIQIFVYQPPRIHLHQMLREDISMLIKLVLLTKGWEREMMQMFSGASADEMEAAEAAGPNGLLPGSSLLAHGGGEVDAAAEARRRLERQRLQMQAGMASVGAAGAGRVEPGSLSALFNPAGLPPMEALAAARAAFGGIISDTFEDALRLYVAGAFA